MQNADFGEIIWRKWKGNKGVTCYYEEHRYPEEEKVPSSFSLTDPLKHVLHCKNNNTLQGKINAKFCDIINFTQQFACLLPKRPFLLLKRICEGSLLKIYFLSMQSCQQKKAKIRKGRCNGSKPSSETFLVTLKLSVQEKRGIFDDNEFSGQNLRREFFFEDETPYFRSLLSGRPQMKRPFFVPTWKEHF